MALMKRSPKMTANWAFAIVHSRGGIFHSFSDRFKIRYSSLVAASSLEKCPRARTARLADVVGAMLARNGQVLLGLRAAHKSFAGNWDIIGGHIETGETQWSALCRELVEEIGVQCVSGDLLDTLNIGSADHPTLLHVYAVSSWEGEPSAQNDEHTEVRWFEWDAAERLPNLAIPLYRAIFASLNR